VQLMIDILADTPAALRLAAQFLMDHAELKEYQTGVGQAPAKVTLCASVPAAHPMPDVPPAPPAGDFHPADLERAQQDMNNNGPLAPPAPPAPMTTSIVSTPTPSAPVASVTADEYDDSGIPFDARIHQKSKNKKKDGTWKIQKGINEAVVTAVMQELAPRIRKVTVPVVPVVPVPGVPTAPPVPNPADLFGHAPLPAGAAAPVSPSVPSVPEANTAQAPAALDPFRALVRKITGARSANRISPDEVNQCVAQGGAPSLQVLGNMPHLVPNVEAAIDLILATR